MILPPEKKQELLISENNSRKPNGILGNKREQPSIPLHTTCTVADINYMLIRHPSTPTRQSRTNTKHTRTNNLQCLLTDPNSISPREVSLKKAPKGPEQSLTQPFTGGKSSSSRQQDPCFKGEHFPTPSQRQACNSPLRQAHAFFHSPVQRKLPFILLLVVNGSALLANGEEICRTELEILCLNLAAERD